MTDGKARLVVAGGLCFGVVAVAYLISRSPSATLEDSEKLFLLFAIMSVPLVAAVAMHLLARGRARRELEQKEGELRKRELLGVWNKPLDGFIDHYLNIAVEWKSLASDRAESRFVVLSNIASIMIVASVLAPLGAIGLYVYLGEGTDWRILFAGVSSGLLFITAAGFLLRQERQERTTYFNLAQEIAFYKNLVTSVRLRMKLEYLKQAHGQEGNPGSDAKTVEELEAEAAAVSRAVEAATVSQVERIIEVLQTPPIPAAEGKELASTSEPGGAGLQKQILDAVDKSLQKITR